MEKDLGLQSKPSKVKECSAARTKFDEDCVQKFYDVLNSWAAIFEDHQDIEYLSSDVLATEGKQKDLLRAKVVGLEKSSTFISERIRSNNIPFYDPIKKKQSKHIFFNECKEKSKNWRQACTHQSRQRVLLQNANTSRKKRYILTFHSFLLQNDYIQVLVHIIPGNLLIDF